MWFGHSISILNATFAALCIAKYIKKDSQDIFKAISKAQAPIPAFCLFLEGS